MLRVLNQEEITALLERGRLGRIACRDENELYIVPVTYLWKDGAVVCHSFEGKKLQMMRRYPEVCFEVEEITDHRNWACVIARGIFEELTDPVQTGTLRDHLRNAALLDKASITAAPPAERTKGDHRLPGDSVFYRIRFISLSGRSERSPQG